MIKAGRISLQLASTPVTARNQMHLDLFCVCAVAAG